MYFFFCRIRKRWEKKINFHDCNFRSSPKKEPENFEFLFLENEKDVNFFIFQSILKFGVSSQLISTIFCFSVELFQCLINLVFSFRELEKSFGKSEEIFILLKKLRTTTIAIPDSVLRIISELAANGLFFHVPTTLLNFVNLCLIAILIGCEKN